jgi:hypothetical protein
LELNAALAMVNDLQPRNTQEAALASQMVAIHWMQMRLSKDALNNGGMVIGESAALAGKLARTYAQQLQTFHLIRGGKKPTRQTITVKKVLEQHVHYHDHRGRGDAGNSSQPDTTGGRTDIAQECPALPSPEKTGRVVRFPGGEGEADVPDARLG